MATAAGHKKPAEARLSLSLMARIHQLKLVAKGKSAEADREVTACIVSPGAIGDGDSGSRYHSFGRAPEILLRPALSRGPSRAHFMQRPTRRGRRWIFGPGGSVAGAPGFQP
jgi:hypothetical protein